MAENGEGIDQGAGIPWHRNSWCNEHHFFNGRMLFMGQPLKRHQSPQRKTKKIQWHTKFLGFGLPQKSYILKLLAPVLSRHRTHVLMIASMAIKGQAQYVSTMVRKNMRPVIHFAGYQV